MNKKLIVPALAVAIVGGGVAGSIINGSAFAANSNSTSDEEVSEQQEQKQLEKEATITDEEAISAALKEVEGKANEAELENVDGAIVYGVEVTDNEGQEHDVKVDAKSGKVLHIKDDEKENENEKGDKEEQQDGEVDDEVEQAQLEKEATLTEDESTSIALNELNGKVTDTELEDEDGTIVYSIEITDDQGVKHDVKVDAKSGKVVNVSADDESENDED